MSNTMFCLLCNACVSIAMIGGIVLLYPTAGGYAFWLLLAMLGHDTIRRRAE
jgi:hypothetical protein